MTVIIANDTPDAVRGMLKRWFIEPRANVFVGTINAKVREKVLDYISRNSEGIGMLIIYSDNSTQGFRTRTIGPTKRKTHTLGGLHLIAEEWVDPENIPF